MRNKRSFGAALALLLTALITYGYAAGDQPAEFTDESTQFAGSSTSRDSCDEQMPGDVDNNGVINNADLVYLVDYLVNDGPAPPVMANADVDGDCCVGEDDINYLSDWMFEQGPDPVDCTCVDPPSCCEQQTPGDVNNDGFIDAADLTYLIAFLDTGGAAPPVLANADVNGDCCIGIDDINYLTEYLFSGGPAPVDCTCLYQELCCDLQMPGDVDNNGMINNADLVYLVDYLVNDGPAPPVMANADVDGDCCVGEDDINYLSDWMFEQGPDPVDCTCMNPPSCCEQQTPGDVNNDGFIDAADLTYLIAFLNTGGTAPPVMANADVNGDCCIGIDDINYLTEYLFSGGPAPVDCTCLYQELCCDLQMPGDVDNNGVINNADLVYLVDYMRNDGPAPPVMANADIDGDCCVGYDDIYYLSDYMFEQGPAPVDCTCMNPPSCCDLQMPGDVNNDGFIDTADLTYLVAFLETGGVAPPVLANADVTGDCCIGPDDVELLTSYLYCGKLSLVDCTCMYPTICCEEQNIGDVDSDGVINQADLVYLVDYLVSGGPAPPEMANADINGDCCVDEDDISYFSIWMFEQGPDPVECTCGNATKGPCDCCRLRGDFTHDGCGPDISDLVDMVSFMFQDGPAPECGDELDINNDTIEADIGDLIYLVSYMFQGGDEPIPCD